MKALKKMGLIMLTYLIVLSSSVTVQADNSNSTVLSDEQMNTLKNTEVFVDNVELFDLMDDDEVFFIIDDVIIFRKNISDNFEIDFSTINSSNLVQPQAQRAITTRLVYKPSNKQNAVYYETFGTLRYGYSLTTLYFSPAGAYKYVARKSDKPMKVVFSFAADSIIGVINKGKFAPAFAILNAISGVIGASRNKQIVELADKGKGVAITTERNSVGGYVLIKEWNQRYIETKTGSETTNGIKKEYTHKLEWGN